MPRRVPVLGHVYRMDPRLYDETDNGHPLLVTSLDPVRRTAELATRTTKPHAKGRTFVVHKADPALRLDAVGWWRLDRTHKVPYLCFGDGDSVEHLGALDEETWSKVLLAKRLARGGASV